MGPAGAACVSDSKAASHQDHAAQGVEAPDITACVPRARQAWPDGGASPEQCPLGNMFMEGPPMPAARSGSTFGTSKPAVRYLWVQYRFMGCRQLKPRQPAVQRQKRGEARGADRGTHPGAGSKQARTLHRGQHGVGFPVKSDGCRHQAKSKQTMQVPPPPCVHLRGSGRGPRQHCTCRPARFAEGPYRVHEQQQHGQGLQCSAEPSKKPSTQMCKLVTCPPPALLQSRLQVLLPRGAVRAGTSGCVW